MNYNSICGVILSGGQSSRIGKDKGLIDFNGKKLILHQIDLLSHFFNHIYISANDNAYSQYNFPVIKDIYKGIGPMGGLHAVMENTDYDYYLFLAVDLPFMNVSTLKLLLNRKRNRHIIIFKHGKFIEPLCAIYPKIFYSEIVKRIKLKDYKLHNLISDSEVDYVNIHHQTKVFKNINYPSDLHV